MALNRLKLVAADALPSWEAFYRFFGAADDEANVAAYRPADRAASRRRTSRAYWEGRSLQHSAGAAISIFARNVYRHGVLGRFIGMAHAAARLYGVDLRELLSARSLEEQRRFFETMLAPLFDKPAVRWATANRLSLYGLGIPPAQYEALAGGGDMGARAARAGRAAGLRLQPRRQLLRLAGLRPRATPPTRRARCRPICGASNSTPSAPAPTASRCSTARSPNFSPAARASRDRYVLLDAQDWMTDAQLDALWRADHAHRTARRARDLPHRRRALAAARPARS